ncbi:MAG: phenylalanine--tRNA ligase subunit beta, partial [Thermoplasmata archaeon]|nr:phenylalanine--tRNA ligase subunit beta [Thermoplasmata archaeon]
MHITLPGLPFFVTSTLISKVEGPFLYTTESPDFSFVPLMKDEEMTLDEILNRHEKGIAYRHILEGKDRYPVILDRNGNVLSFPPVINGVLTAVREDTTELFIDITGMELRPVTLALNILTTAFAERGADIESVEINYDPSHPLIGGEGLITPDLSWRKTTVSVKELNRLLNTSLPAEDWILPFKRMALRAEPVNGGKELKVGHPAYRADILHPWDIFEDAAIGLGYENIIEAHPSLQTTGAPLEIVPLVRRFQRAMTGLGFSEVKTLTLIGKKDGYENMDHPVPEDDIVLLNPITGDHTRLRVSLLPSLLSILRANRHRELPQRIFEAGIVVENGKNVWKGAGLAIHYRAGFTEIKSTVISLLPAFGKVFSLHPLPHPSFVLGRCAGIKIGDKEIGYFGELHPGVITAFELEYPVVAFEVYLEALRRVHSHFMG